MPVPGETRSFHTISTTQIAVLNLTSENHQLVDYVNGFAAEGFAFLVREPFEIHVGCEFKPRSRGPAPRWHG